MLHLPYLPDIGRNIAWIGICTRLTWLIHVMCMIPTPHILRVVTSKLLDPAFIARNIQGFVHAEAKRELDEVRKLFGGIIESIGASMDKNLNIRVPLIQFDATSIDKNVNIRIPLIQFDSTILEFKNSNV